MSDQSLRQFLPKISTKDHISMSPNKRIAGQKRALLLGFATRRGAQRITSPSDCWTPIIPVLPVRNLRGSEKGGGQRKAWKWLNFRFNENFRNNVHFELCGLKCSSLENIRKHLGRRVPCPFLSIPWTTSQVMWSEGRKVTALLLRAERSDFGKRGQLPLNFY